MTRQLALAIGFFIGGLAGVLAARFGLAVIIVAAALVIALQVALAWHDRPWKESTR